MIGNFVDSRGQRFDVAFNRSGTASYWPGLGDSSGDPNCAVGMPYDVVGNPCPGVAPPPAFVPAAPAPAPPASYMLPSNMQAVTFADGTKGFLDPADGTYYDSQGNDVTGYVQNFGGAKVTGPASAAAVAAAEGISAPGITPPKTSSTIAINLPPGPAPRVTVPGVAAATMANPFASLGGMSSSTLLMLGAAAVLVVSLTSGGGRRR